jgi:alkylation response protein AidB-like acyl-CoA dehydrogenase
VDLQLTPEQQQLRDATRRVLGARLEALVARLPEPPVHDADQVLKDAQDLGWLGLALPAEADGVGDFTDLAVVHEELGRGLAPGLVPALHVAGRLLLHAGGGADLLGRIARGELLVVPTPVASASGPRVSGSLRHVVEARSATHLLVTARDDDRVALVLVPVDAPGVSVVDEPSSTEIAHSRV